MEQDPNTHLPQLQAVFHEQGAEGVVAFINAFPIFSERKALYGLAQRSFAQNDAPDLDALITIVQAGISDCIREAARETTAGNVTEAAKRIDAANIFSYNLAADLAECWPNDQAPRTRQHFEIGVRLAEDCVRWREQLQKGPRPFALAWWAKGVHHLSLGNTAEAVESFRNALHYADLAAAAAQIEANRDFGSILASGYLALALQESGDPEGKELFTGACQAFEKLLADGGESAEDAQLGLDQLNTMRARLAAHAPGRN